MQVTVSDVSRRSLEVFHRAAEGTATPGVIVRDLRERIEGEDGRNMIKQGSSERRDCEVALAAVAHVQLIADPDQLSQVKIRG